MFIEMWVVIVAVELVVGLTIAAIAFTWISTNSERKWKRKAQKAQERVAKLKQYKNRYDQVEENLQRALEEIKTLKQALEDEKNNPFLQQKINRLETDFKELENNQESLTGFKSKYENLQKTHGEGNTNKDQKITDLNLEINQLKTELNLLKENTPLVSIDNSENIIDDDLKIKSQNQRKEINDLLIELSDEDSDTEIVIGTAMIERLERNLKESNTIIEMLETELDMINKSSSEAVSNDEFNQLEAQLISSEEEVSALKKELSEKPPSDDSLAPNAVSKDEFDQLEAQLMSSEDQLTNLKKELAEMESIWSAGDQGNENEASASNSDDNNEKLESELSTANDQIKSLTRELAEMEVLWSTGSSEEITESEDSSGSTEVTQLQADLNDAKIQIESLTKELTEMESIWSSAG